MYGAREYKFYTLFGILLAAFLVALAPRAKSAEYEWRMISIAPESSLYVVEFANRFADYADKLTDGRVKIQVVPGGVLAPPFGEYDAVVDGISETGNLPPIYIVNLDPANALLGGLPGGMNIEQMIQWVYFGGGLELWQEFRREEMGLHALVAGIGPTEIINSHRPIKSLDDLVGLRFRTAGLWARMLQEVFDGAPVTVPGAEVYTMLDRQAIDAAEWSAPAENLVMGLHEAANYIVIPGIHQPTFTFEAVMPVDRWEALPDDIKSSLEIAAKLTTLESAQSWIRKDLDALAKMRDDGSEIVEIDPATVEEIRTRARAFIEELGEAREAEGNPWLARISKSYYDYMDHYNENSVYLDR